MCDKIEELEKKIADLEMTNDLLRTLVKKKDARIQELREDYDELTQDANELEKKNERLKVTIHGYIQENFDLYKAKEKLENENKQLQYYVDDWKDRSETAQNLFERSCDHVTGLEKENEDLKKQLANALDLYDERGEVIEKHEELKAAIKTILNSIYGVDTDGDKMEGIK